MLLGLVAALARMSRFAPFRWISAFYVWIFRGTPLLVQIFYVYFAFAWPTLQFGFWTITDAAIAGIKIATLMIANVVRRKFMAVLSSAW